MKELNEEKAMEELKKGYPKAEELLKDQEKTEEFLRKLEKKLKLIPKVGDTLAYAPIMVSFVRSYINKEYREVPMGTIVAIVSALIYVLAPIDLISDAIPGIGYIDDAFVIGACLKLVKSDIDEYQVWRENKDKVLKRDLTKKVQ